jgi:hypothetical protein
MFGSSRSNRQEDVRDELSPLPHVGPLLSYLRRRARDGSARIGVGPSRVETHRSLVRLLSQTHHRSRLPVFSRAITNAAWPVTDRSASHLLSNDLE